ncbi:hypothetical protein QL285_036235 [Trifolium repens]|nr:hypothetical protein QL285_036235 [Trifolium repens]
MENPSQPPQHPSQIRRRPTTGEEQNTQNRTRDKNSNHTGKEPQHRYETHRTTTTKSKTKTRSRKKKPERVKPITGAETPPPAASRHHHLRRRRNTPTTDSHTLKDQDPETEHHHLHRETERHQAKTEHRRNGSESEKRNRRQSGHCDPAEQPPPRLKQPTHNTKTSVAPHKGTYLLPKKQKLSDPPLTTTRRGCVAGETD